MVVAPSEWGHSDLAGFSGGADRNNAPADENARRAYRRFGRCPLNGRGHLRLVAASASRFARWTSQVGSEQPSRQLPSSQIV